MDRNVAVRALATLLSVAALGAAWLLRAAPVEVAAGSSLANVPQRLGGWEGRDVTVESEVVQWLRSDALLLRAYEDEEGVPVWVLVDYHRAQGLGATVHSPRHCYLGTGRSVTPRATPGVAGGSARLALAQWLTVRREDDTLAAAYWYETRSGATSDELALKLRIASAALRRRASDVALVRLTTPMTSGHEADAERRIARFAAAALDSLTRALPFEATS